MTDTPMTIEVSAVREDIDGCETVNDAPDKANIFSVYIRNPHAFHVQDYPRSAGWPSVQKADAFTYADALAEHLGCKVVSSLRRDDAVPEVSDIDLAESAMCIWEEMLQLKATDRDIIRLFDSIGTAEMRVFALSLAKPCHLAWELAQADGYDDPFDWNFVPEWLAENVDWTGSNPTKLNKEARI